jgi:hypothetical protein
MALAQRMRNSYNSPGVGGDLPAKPGRSRGIEGGGGRCAVVFAGGRLALLPD